MSTAEDHGAEFIGELADLHHERDTLLADLARVTAERDRLRAACKYFRQWLDEYDTDRELHPSLRQTLDAVLKPTT